MGDQTPERRGDRSLDEFTDDELLDLISELPDDDELASAIRALIERRRRRGQD